MNIALTGIIIFVIAFLLLSWFARANSKKITKNVRSLIIALSIIIAVLLAIGGRILFSLPLFFLALSALKIKGLTAFQIWQMWRLLNFLRSTGRFSYFGQTNQSQTSTGLSIDESYKILNLKKGCTKEEVNKAANNIQKKIHPDVSPETARLSALVNEARDNILKNIS